jgi:hypothetical protein
VRLTVFVQKYNPESSTKIGNGLQIRARTSYRNTGSERARSNSHSGENGLHHAWARPHKEKAAASRRNLKMFLRRFRGFRRLNLKNLRNRRDQPTNSFELLPFDARTVFSTRLPSMRR